MTSRLEARLPTDVHTLLKGAAEMQGRTLTDFVVTAAYDAACRAIEEAGTVRLSVADQHRFADAILSPPEPNAGASGHVEGYLDALERDGSPSKAPFRRM